MFKVIVHNVAEDTLVSLFKSDKIMFGRICDALDSLEEKGLESSNLKKLTGTKDIYRKRVGRWRILFTFHENIIDVWIVAVEKDTRKDYNRWIRHITYHVEAR